MKRISIFIDEEMVTGLAGMAKSESVKQHRAVTMAEIIRNGIRKELEAGGVLGFDDSFIDDDGYVPESGS